MKNEGKKKFYQKNILFVFTVLSKPQRPEPSLSIRICNTISPCRTHEPSMSSDLTKEQNKRKKFKSWEFFFMTSRSIKNRNPIRFSPIECFGKFHQSKNFALVMKKISTKRLSELLKF